MESIYFDANEQDALAGLEVVDTWKDGVETFKYHKTDNRKRSDNRRRYQFKRSRSRSCDTDEHNTVRHSRSSSRHTPLTNDVESSRSPSPHTPERDIIDSKSNKTTLGSRDTPKRNDSFKSKTNNKARCSRSPSPNTNSRCYSRVTNNGKHQNIFEDDLENTGWNIEKNSSSDDINKAMITGRLKLVETGLIPPGTEMDFDIQKIQAAGSSVDIGEKIHKNSDSSSFDLTTHTRDKYTKRNRKHSIGSSSSSVKTPNPTRSSGLNLVNQALPLQHSNLKWQQSTQQDPYFTSPYQGSAPSYHKNAGWQQGVEMDGQIDEHIRNYSLNYWKELKKAEVEISTRNRASKHFLEELADKLKFEEEIKKQRLQATNENWNSNRPPMDLQNKQFIPNSGKEIVSRPSRSSQPTSTMLVKQLSHIPVVHSTAKYDESFFIGSTTKTNPHDSVGISPVKPNLVKKSSNIVIKLLPSNKCVVPQQPSLIAPQQSPLILPLQPPLAVQRQSPLMVPQHSPLMVPQQSSLIVPRRSPFIEPQRHPLMVTQQSPLTVPQQSPLMVPQQSPLIVPRRSPLIEPQRHPLMVPQQSPLMVPQQSPLIVPQLPPLIVPRQSPLMVPQQSPLIVPQRSPLIVPRQSPLIVPQQSPLIVPRLPPLIVPRQSPLIVHKEEDKKPDSKFVVADKTITLSDDSNGSTKCEDAAYANISTGSNFSNYQQFYTNKKEEYVTPSCTTSDLQFTSKIGASTTIMNTEPSTEDLSSMPDMFVEDYIEDSYFPEHNQPSTEYNEPPRHIQSSSEHIESSSESSQSSVESNQPLELTRPSFERTQLFPAYSQQAPEYNQRPQEHNMRPFFERTKLFPAYAQSSPENNQPSEHIQASPEGNIRPFFESQPLSKPVIKPITFEEIREDRHTIKTTIQEAPKYVVKSKPIQKLEVVKTIPNFGKWNTKVADQPIRIQFKHCFLPKQKPVQDTKSLSFQFKQELQTDTTDFGSSDANLIPFNLQTSIEEACPSPPSMSMTPSPPRLDIIPPPEMLEPPPPPIISDLYSMNSKKRKRRRKNKH